MSIVPNGHVPNWTLDRTPQEDRMDICNKRPHGTAGMGGIHMQCLVGRQNTAIQLSKAASIVDMFQLFHIIYR